MPAQAHVPVLCWPNGPGVWTACLAEDPKSGVATAATADEALRQLEELLEWMRRKMFWSPTFDFEDPQLVWFKIEVRPQYQEEERVYPCPEAIRLRLPGVCGQQADGASICSLPTLGLRFDFNAGQDLPVLVSHFVNNQLRELTPRQLLRHWPPAEVELRDLVVKTSAWLDTGHPPSIQEQCPQLAAVAETMTSGRDQAARFGQAWGRQALVDQLLSRLTQEKASVILVGEAGVGKTTLLAETARRLQRSSTAESGPANRVWLTNAARLIAGMKYLGQWEERCERIIDELAGLGGILGMENLLDLVQLGGQGPADSIAAFLLPYLQRSELRLVAEATPAELEACRRLLPGFADVFQILVVPPFDDSQAMDALGRVFESAGRNHHLDSDPEARALVYRLHQRFLPYHSFPGKTVAFVQRLGEEAVRQKCTRITIRQVVEQFLRATGLPEVFLRDDLLLEFDEVLRFFRGRVLGQEAACQAAANVVTTFKAGLNDPQRPLGVLLFCGPTGVGKTALAGALADYFFGQGLSRERMVRLDMSEYSAPWAARRLLFGPDGGPSELIKKLRQQPLVVLLLDEIEKAAPEVFDLFLNVFDEGRLTDPLGRLTHFQSAVIIMTSNLGASRGGSLGFGPSAGPSYEAEAMNFFRPEFYNRIDAVVSFQPLGEEAILGITRKELGEISRREGLAKAGLRLAWDDPLVRHLAQTGFDPRFGARPLQRALEQEVITPLARFLLAQPSPQNTTLHLAWRDDRLQISVD